MAGVLHGSARTTPRARAELQASKEKTSVLAKRYRLSRTTVAKWRTRASAADAPMGPRDPRSTVLTPIKEAIIVEFRRRALLPLDDVMGCLKDTIPKTVSVKPSPLPGASWDFPQARKRSKRLQTRSLRQDGDQLCPY
jgi:hypothetical protein